MEPVPRERVGLRVVQAANGRGHLATHCDAGALLSNAYTVTALEPLSRSRTTARYA